MQYLCSNLSIQKLYLDENDCRYDVNPKSETLKKLLIGMQDVL